MPTGKTPARGLPEARIEVRRGSGLLRVRLLLDEGDGAAAMSWLDEMLPALRLLDAQARLS